MIPRDVRILVDNALNKTNKVVILLGARQVGKTTLVQTIQRPEDVYLFQKTQDAR
jgi:predicted AAA+ superfamily ATPase